MTSHFETIAKHFANKLTTRVVFKAKATPMTDGTTIILPKSLSDENLLPTLGALLHESHHIKYTDMSAMKPEMEWTEGYHKASQFLLNLLEDIRIDHKVFKEYPSARILYKKLLDTVFSDKDFDKSQITEMFIILTQHIYLYGVGFENLFYRKEIFTKFYNESKKELDTIIEVSKKAKKTKDLHTQVKRLYGLLKDFIKKENNLKSLKNHITKSKAKSTEMQNEIDDHKKQIVDNSKRIGKNQDKISKLRKEKYDEDLTAGEKNEIEQEMQDLKTECDKLNKSNSIQQTKEDKIYSEKNQLEKQIERIEEMLEKCDDKEESLDIEAMFDEELTHGSSNDYLNGFKSLNDNCKITSKKEEIVDFEDCMRHIFKRLEQERNLNNSTGKINLDKVYKIFNSQEDNYNDIFIQNRMKESYNNKIIFLLDTSGSMGSFSSIKNQTLFNCVSSLMKVIEEKKEDYNIEYSVGLFSDMFKEIKKFDETISEEMFYARYRNKFMGGNTNIYTALDDCYKLLEDQAHIKDKKFIIVFTDAEFTSDDSNKILDEYDARPEKVIFIGIGKEEKCHYNKTFYEKILMNRMVRTTSEMEKALIDGFDRLM
jgi:uncharacterized protein with von Willebrand factor type A (vWA) domain